LNTAAGLGLVDNAMPSAAACRSPKRSGPSHAIGSMPTSGIANEGEAWRVVINFMCAIGELCFAKRAYNGNIGE
jgi:hypothetical protein